MLLGADAFADEVRVARLGVGEVADDEVGSASPVGSP